MLQRITLVLLALFWVTMNVLLWRSEFGGRNRVGTAVPLEMVWRKMLTAADSSSLEILQHGRKIGYCRWDATQGQDTTSNRHASGDLEPEGMVESFSSYRIDFEGNTTLGEVVSNRVRFEFSITLDTNSLWQEFRLRVYMRPDAWEFHSRASEAAVHVLTDEGGARSELNYKFADLENPLFLAKELDMPMLPGLLAGYGISVGDAKKPPLSFGLAWESRNDWITIGHSAVRAYRLEAHLLDRYKIVVMVSRVGEILRVELPDDFELINDQLTSL